MNYRVELELVLLHMSQKMAKAGQELSLDSSCKDVVEKEQVICNWKELLLFSSTSFAPFHARAFPSLSLGS